MDKWHPIPDYEGYYEVWISEDSHSGTIQSLSRTVLRMTGGRLRPLHIRCRILRPTIRKGYLTVNLYKDGHCKQARIHRIVAEIEHGNRPHEMDTAHANNVKVDNRPSNLSYISKPQNVKNAKRDGLIVRGESHPEAKLNASAVLVIRKLQGVKTQTALAAAYGVSQALIWCIQHRKAWVHVA